jgi:hypothetical protein
MRWNHGIVTPSYLPESKDNTKTRTANEEANDGSTLPSVFGPSPLKSQKDHDDGGSEKESAEKVQVFQSTKNRRSFR